MIIYEQFILIISNFTFYKKNNAKNYFLIIFYFFLLLFNLYTNGNYLLKRKMYMNISRI